jgi:hypothetical protein
MSDTNKFAPKDAIVTPMDIHLVKSLKILQRTLKEWYSDKSHEGKEPFIHIKIYEKIARSEFLQFERELAIQQMEKWWARHQDKIDDIRDKIPVKLKTRRTKVIKKSADISMKKDASSTFILPSSTNIYEVLEVEELLLETPYDDLSMNVEVIHNQFIKQSFKEDDYKRELRLRTTTMTTNIEPIEIKPKVLQVTRCKPYNINPPKSDNWVNEMLKYIDDDEELAKYQLKILSKISILLNKN